MTIESLKDSDAPKKDASKLDSIQALRGVAILFVLLAHIKNCEIAYGGAHLTPFLAFGNMGVDLFFCISGFIMVTITGGRAQHSVAQVKNFFLKRVIRIYPLYWVFMILSIVMWHYVTAPFYAHVPAADFSYYLKSTLLFPDPELPALNQGWSLIFEIYFYIVFGIFLLFARKLLLPLLLGWACCVAIGNFLPLPSPKSSSGAFVEVVTQQMTLEFICGCLIALLVQTKPRHSILPPLIVGGIAFAVTVAANPFHRHFFRLAWFGIPTILILYTCVLGEARRLWKYPPWLVSIGDISYSLYLSHILTFTLLGTLWSHLITRQSLALSLLFAAILGLTAVVVAALSYNFIEQPILNLSRKLFLKRPQKSHG